MQCGLQVKCHACVHSIREDARILEAGVHMVVGTPGRVYDMHRRRMLQFDSVRMFMLNEADEMLSRGFKDLICDILQMLPPKLQVGSAGRLSRDARQALLPHGAASDKQCYCRSACWLLPCLLRLCLLRS